MKIYSVLFNDAAHLDSIGELSVVRHPLDMESPKGVLLLHGGADISPAIYKHKISKYSQANINPSARDVTEILCAKKAMKLGMPIFGICRGAQLLCALAGGSLIQHTDGHTGGKHKITEVGGKTMYTTTCHHQMMNLKNTEHDLRAWCDPGLSSFYFEENDQKTHLEKEPEIVVFPKIKALAVQGHPEWMSESSELVQYCKNILTKELL